MTGKNKLHNRILNVLIALAFIAGVVSICYRFQVLYKVMVEHEKQINQLTENQNKLINLNNQILNIMKGVK